MHKEGVSESKKQEIDTYETLQEKALEMKNSIQQTETDINASILAMNEAKKLAANDIDDLDSFMDNLSKTEKGSGGKEKISKLKQLLQTQQNELRRIEKLMNIAKPTEMPKLSSAVKIGTKGVMIGKRYGLGKTVRTINPITEHKVETPKAVSIASPSLPTLTDEDKVTHEESKSMELDDSEKVPEKTNTKKKKKKQRNAHLKATLLQDSNVTVEQSLDDESKIPGDYDASDEKYATWVPPSNQTGDGRTSLNEKLGY